MTRFRHGFFILSALLALSSCSSGPRTQEPPLEEPPKADPAHDTETIAVMGTNDLHGALAPQELRTREAAGAPGTPYEAAGVATLSSFVRVLRSELGERLVWLDGGDEFQGSIESNLEQGAPMVSFFNAAGVQGAAIGNHEFDFGLDALKARMTEAHYPYLAANIVEKATGQLAQFPNTIPHTTIQVSSKLKVGVLGLSTLDTPRTTKSENVATLRFADLKEATIREAKALREEGAQVVLITAHVGLKCDRGRVGAGLLMRKPTDAQGECDSDGEMVRLLRSLPEGTVDAVVSGHSHQVVHHWIAGIPVIQGGAFGRYFNLIWLTYDFTEKRLLTENTRIEGPVPVCEKVFRNQNDCNGDRPAPPMGRGPLVEYRYHGKTIEPDSSIVDVLKPVFAKSAEEKKKVVGQAARPLDHERFRESPLGDLVADSFRKATGADVALINAGGIRAPWEAGPITFGDVFRTLPFDNTIVVLKVTGRELKNILRVAESGARGFASVSGLHLKLIEPGEDTPGNDLNGDHKI
ncbi:MAG: bifunctional metallophosphatase/5'-nucleotidase, partial [Bdellovibrionota bacterium]